MRCILYFIVPFCFFFGGVKKKEGRKKTRLVFHPGRFYPLRENI